MRKAVLVDRDDTLCKDIPYCDDPAKIKPFPGVPEAIAKLNAAGFLVLMVTNQSGIGRGYFTVETLEKVNGSLLQQIGEKGGRIDDIFFCPHRPEDNCGCRKPRIGLGLNAIEKYNLDPSECWMIGDKDKDMEFGKALGMKTIMVSDTCSFTDAVTQIIEKTAPLPR